LWSQILIPFTLTKASQFSGGGSWSAIYKEQINQSNMMQVLKEKNNFQKLCWLFISSHYWKNIHKRSI
jgi:hypothetical protein